jgi:hypothetical protein
MPERMLKISGLPASFQAEEQQQLVTDIGA